MLLKGAQVNDTMLKEELLYKRKAIDSLSQTTVFNTICRQSVNLRIRLAKQDTQESEICLKVTNIAIKVYQQKRKEQLVDLSKHQASL